VFQALSGFLCADVALHTWTLAFMPSIVLLCLSLMLGPWHMVEPNTTSQLRKSCANFRASFCSVVHQEENLWHQ